MDKSVGRAMICETEVAKKPYCFLNIQQKIYSYEELCYFICCYPALFQFEFLTPELVVWVEQEIKAERLAEKLQKLLDENASCRAAILTVLEAYPYCTAEEVKKVIEKLDFWNLQEPWRQKKHFADALYKIGQYKVAKKLYDCLLLEVPEIDDYTVIRGALYHNRGSCLARDMQYKEAVESFYKAYELHPCEETLKGYWRVLYLLGDQETIKFDLAQKELPLRLYSEFIEIMEQKLEELADNQDFKKLERAFLLKEQGDLTDYHKKMQNLLTKWKREYKDTIR